MGAGVGGEVILRHAQACTRPRNDKTSQISRQVVTWIPPPARKADKRSRKVNHFGTLALRNGSFSSPLYNSSGIRLKYSFPMDSGLCLNHDQNGDGSDHACTCILMRTY
ncbi:hypothetical protein RRG08_040170 [Elysia crispata]|uniref:Uncharacterized protein n=1 Tax=Elysia crispata TaxID=231223 RepID=A0AAE1CNG8_9GAST|nr:hypothetical protein RRG08_040170 [Elysia crispata]